MPHSDDAVLGSDFLDYAGIGQPRSQSYEFGAPPQPHGQHDGRHDGRGAEDLYEPNYGIRQDPPARYKLEGAAPQPYGMRDVGRHYDDLHESNYGRRGEQASQQYARAPSAAPPVPLASSARNEHGDRFAKPAAIAQPPQAGGGGSYFLSRAEAAAALLRRTRHNSGAKHFADGCMRIHVAELALDAGALNTLPRTLVIEVVILGEKVHSFTAQLPAEVSAEQRAPVSVPLGQVIAQAPLSISSTTIYPTLGGIAPALIALSSLATAGDKLRGRPSRPR